jgi:anti-sigma factor RsiW
MTRTDCSRIRGLLADHHASLLDGRRAHEVAAHVAECEACAAELAALGRTTALLDATEPARPSRDLWPQIAAQLKPRERPRVWWGPPLPAQTRLGLQVATVVLLVLALAVVLPLHWNQGPAVPLPQGTDDEAALFAHWHAQASLTSGFSNVQGLSLVAATQPPEEAQ